MLNEIVDLHKDWLHVEQQRDDEIRQLIANWNFDNISLNLFKTYDVRNNILFRKIERDGKSKWLPIVPHSMAWSIINRVHVDLKHLGWEKTLNKLYEFYWFPNMSKNVKKFFDT